MSQKITWHFISALDNSEMEINDTESSLVAGNALDGG